MIGTEKVAHAAANLVSTIGGDDFNANVFNVLSRYIAIDHCTAFSVSNGEAMNLLVGAATSQKRSKAKSLAASYIGGAWAQDPIWGNVCSAEVFEPTTALIDPSSYYQESHRISFYDSLGITQEIAIVGEDCGTQYYVSLYRRHGQPCFTEADVHFVTTLSLPLMRVLAKHREICGSRGCSDQNVATAISHEKMYDMVRMALLDEEAKLTEREAEICAGIVMGYSATALSLNLGISKNTVATHRKRAYAKLSICSQNELFSRYFSIVNSGVLSSPVGDGNLLSG